ncbi:hypothetical protein DIPPA_54606 [Diplonema papillatum]|nr:hypothetical protein DIPPA_54606 [Diplonema papillatum]
MSRSTEHGESPREKAYSSGAYFPSYPYHPQLLPEPAHDVAETDAYQFWNDEFFDAYNEALAERLSRKMTRGRAETKANATTDVGSRFQATAARDYRFWPDPWEYSRSRNRERERIKLKRKAGTAMALAAQLPPPHETLPAHAASHAQGSPAFLTDKQQLLLLQRSLAVPVRMESSPPPPLDSVDQRYSVL